MKQKFRKTRKKGGKMIHDIQLSKTILLASLLINAIDKFKNDLAEIYNHK